MSDPAPHPNALATIAPPSADELLVVVGPTASGKTDAAIALCERFDGEVIGADSIQVYRRFDVGSGKPTVAERARARHHLIDIADATDALDARRFVTLADAAIDDVRARRKTPIVCGGTFLWIKALVRGLAAAPPADEETRARHAAIARDQGRAALHARLALIDPVTAARLAPNDFVRVSRALEVFELSGKTMSAWHAEHGFKGDRHRVRLIGVRREREELDRRIATRTRAWLESGWIEEVRALCADGLGETRAMGSVGYKQVRDHLRGTIAREDLADAIVRATRIFVRRQRTWLRDEPVIWLDA